MSDYRDRLRKHYDAQDAFAAEYERTHGPPGTKALEGAPENKMLAGDAAGLENKSKAELRALAAERGVEVTRADGRTDLEPTRDDYLRALG